MWSNANPMQTGPMFGFAECVVPSHDRTCHDGGTHRISRKLTVSSVILFSQGLGLACGDTKETTGETSSTGSGSESESSSSTGEPMECPPSTLEFTQVSAGPGKTCGVTIDGRIACWGIPEYPPCERFRFVDAGSSNATCGITVDDHVLCWYREESVSFSPKSLTCNKIAVGAGFLCCLGTDHKLECFGSIGGDSLPDLPVPQDIDMAHITAGGYHGCALDFEGVVHCWGDGSTPGGPPPDWQDATNDEGQGRPVPGVYASIDADGAVTCGLHPDGKVDCWGSVDGTLDQIPDGTFEAIAVGFQFACGLRKDGSITCWGANIEGKASPPCGTFVQVDAGMHHACALRSDGSVACWGQNLNGETEPPIDPTRETDSSGSTTAESTSTTTDTSMVVGAQPLFHP